VRSRVGPTAAVWIAGLVPTLLAAGPDARAEPPRRIASLNLTADEILVEILPPARLVAATTFADEVGTSNIVGRIPATVPRFFKADMERLLALRPDLVVVSEYTDADFLEQLRRSGLRAHRMEGLGSLSGCRGAILRLGEAVGEAEAAAGLVARFDRTLAELARLLEGARRPRVLYWANPHTAGADTAIGSLIECAGGRNAARELGLTGITPIGAERAFLLDPEVVLLATFRGATEALHAHPLLSKMPAVRAGRVVQLPNQLLVTLSQHVADACWCLASSLHPDRVPRPGP
jgi:ABC-type Fe3+-hydroxamate transport system substrate-binding protein